MKVHMFSGDLSRLMSCFNIKGQIKSVGLLILLCLFILKELLKPVKIKLTRNRNATNLFPHHFLHVVLNCFIFIYRYAGLYTFHALSIAITTLLPVILPPLQKCTCGSCGLTTWRFDKEKVCIHVPDRFT